MTPKELQKYYQSKYPQKSALTQEELNWISSQEDIDWAIDNVLQARQNKNTEDQHERNKRYWSNPIKNIFNNWIEGKPIKDIFKGINERWSASLDSNTNPINGLVNVGLPAAALTGVVMNPFGTAGAIALGGAAALAGDAAINAATDGKYVSVPGFIQDKTGLSRFTSELVNPLMLLGGKYGYKGGTNIGSKLFNGLHLPIGYDPVDGWYKRRPYPIMQQPSTLPSAPTVGASVVELGQKPFAVLPPSSNTAAIPASARRVQALSTPTEIPSSGVSIATPPTDLSRGTWDFYRATMQENPVLALPSVQAWLQQYGDVRTPQQWMLAGTRNLNLQSGYNNPRSVLYRAFGNVYGRNGVYRGTMPPFAPGVQPMRYEFAPGQENPLVGQFHIEGQPSFEYDISNLPFRADFQPVIRGGSDNSQYAGDPVMRLAADRTTLTRGEGNSYLDIFARPLDRAQRRIDNQNLYRRGLLPRRGTVRIQTIGGMQFPVGTNIFGEQIIHRLMPAENGTFTRRWDLMPNLDTEFFNVENPIPHFEDNTNLGEFIRNLGPLTEEGAQLESLPEVIYMNPDGTFTPTPLKLVDPFSGPSQNRGLALPGNMGHYQLKSLMQGSPLEKQLSKDGTININSLNAHLKKASDIERVIVEKVLQTKFPNQKSVDYNQLKLEVQKELIQNYSRKPQSKWTTYGLDRLGYSTDKVSDGAGDIFEITPDGKVQTFTFESDQIPTGHAKHYGPSSLGHVRLFTSNDAPQILYVLENQSDWGQSTNLLASDAPARTPIQMEFDFSQRINAYLKGRDDALLSEFQTEDAINQYFNKLQVDRIKNGRRPARHQGTQQQIYLHDNYFQRQLHEILRLASQQKQTAVRFPTRETAAKIEQYPQRTAKIDKLPEGYEGLQELVDKLYALQDQYVQAKVNWDIYRQGTGRNLTIEEDVTRRPDYAKFQKEMKGLAKQINAYPGSPYRISAVGAKDIGTSIFFDLYEVVDPRKQEYAYENILKKYSDFPKMWKKLFKTEPRIVTDSKGNTWYEVDVPEGYLDQEWQFKTGGKLNYLTMFR